MGNSSTPSLANANLMVYAPAAVKLNLHIGGVTIGEDNVGVEPSNENRISETSPQIAPSHYHKVIHRKGKLTLNNALTPPKISEISREMTGGGAAAN